MAKDCAAKAVLLSLLLLMRRLEDKVPFTQWFVARLVERGKTQTPWWPSPGAIQTPTLEALCVLGARLGGGFL